MKFTPISYTCPSCGAPLKFSPSTGKLTCEFCHTSTEIAPRDNQIEEFDLHSALSRLDQNSPKEINKEVECSKCGNNFTLTPFSVSTNCPYCGTPAITEFVNSIKPESIIPFEITQKEAKQIFAKWINSLWFTPGKLKKLVDTDKALKGYYLPFWTFDADTVTPYRGQRGDIYYVTVRKRVIIDGKEQIVHTQEPRIKWTHTSGEVRRYFDDVTVEASNTLSRKIISQLGNWDTSRSKPFDEEYLSGFDSEEYSIGLDNGFEMARSKMDTIIRYDIYQDIGGDKQQIDWMQTHYHNNRFKNALFPIWTANFEYKNKTYYYAINGQTGEIAGERPYSYTKIFLIIAFVLAVLVAIGVYSDYFDGLKSSPPSLNYDSGRVIYYNN